jgi:hypothetical protein
MRRKNSGPALAVEPAAEGAMARWAAPRPAAARDAIEMILADIDLAAAPDPMVLFTPEEAGFRFDTPLDEAPAPRGERAAPEDFRHCLRDDFGDDAFERPGGVRPRRPSFFVGLSGAEPDEDMAPEDWAVGIDDIGDNDGIAEGHRRALSASSTPARVELRAPATPIEDDSGTGPAGEITMIPTQSASASSGESVADELGHRVTALVIDADGYPIARVVAA